MAKDAKPATEGVETAPAKNSKKLLIIIIAVVVVVLGLGGVTAFLLLRHAPEQDDDGEVAVEKTKPVKKKKVDREVPIYVALDAFTVNLVPDNGDQFLQLVMSLEVEDAQVADQLKMYTPKLRNDLTLLLSSKKASQLISKEGKELLAQEVKEQINGIIEPAGKGKKRDGPIKEVLFTSFIIQ